jgi:hypothetical protein
MTARLLSILAAVSIASASAQENQTPPKCSISGSVEDSVSHQPMDGFDVMLNPGQKSVVSDAKGNFEFKDIDPGTYRVVARLQFQVSSQKSVSLTCGQDLTGTRLQVDPMSTIVGTVLDENGEPVMGAEVDLVAGDYYRGKLRYILVSTATANDKGDYTLTRVRPGHKYLVYASRRERKLDAISKVPANPKLRKKVFEPAYFGGADRPEGAQMIIARPGERKEGVDFKLRRTQGWCMDGVIRDGAEPAESFFQVAESQPHSGFSPSADGGTFKVPPSGQTGKDGKFRVCDLHPGEYSITTAVFRSQDSGPDIPTMFAVTEASITDSDLHDLKITPRPRIPISGEVVWDGPAPAQPAQGQLQLYVNPIGRAGWQGEHEWLDAKSHIPGQFAFPGLFMDQYNIRIRGVPTDSYLKEATYSGTSMLTAPIVPGSRGDSSMRIVLARDGGVIQAKAVDKDGQPLPDTSLVIFPADIGSPALLADSLVRASTDQNGAYTSGRLAPGKYTVIATDSNVDFSADFIDRLWAARSKAEPTELAVNGTASVTLQVTPIN